MPTRPDYDVVILGGGLAGLSLAMRLIGLPSCRTLVIEPRTAYRRDRTWSYWPLASHPFEGAVTKRWSSWEVWRAGTAGRSLTATQTLADLPYCTIPADRLYDAAREAIERAPHIELRLGVSAEALVEEPDRVRVATSRGEVAAARVFDGRPPAGPRGGLVQRFLGQEVTTDRAVFDPATATLMDFNVPQRPGTVHFLYVLPTSPTQALVEDTWLAPAATPLPDPRDAIRRYLASRFGATRYEVGFEEDGAIPMDPGLQAGAAAGRIIAIGTAGGAIKPSSGYGFLAIQRMAERLAADLAAGRTPRPFQPRTRAARWMDEISSCRPATI